MEGYALFFNNSIFVNWGLHTFQTYVVGNRPIFVKFLTPVFSGSVTLLSYSFRPGPLRSWYLHNSVLFITDGSLIWIFVVEAYTVMVKCHQMRIIFFSCDQAALWMVQSVCLSVCPSVHHTFFTMFPSWYHHEIFSYYQWQRRRPCKRTRSEVKGQGHRGQHPT